MLRRVFVASLALTALATGCVDPEDTGGDELPLSGPEASSGVIPPVTAGRLDHSLVPGHEAPRRDDPHPMARGLEGAQGLQLHGGFAYVVTIPSAGGPGASIARVSDAGGEVVEVVRGNDPWGFGVDRLAIYWADLSARAILVTTRPDGPVKTLADAGGPPVLFAMDATHLYWATPDGEVRGTSKAGPRVERIARLEDTPIALAIDASSVYVAAGDALYRVSRGGGPLEKIAADESFGSWLLVDRHSIYWASPSHRTIRRLDKGGSAPVTLVDQVDAAGAALGPDWLYFTDAGERAVKKVLLSGGTPIDIAQGQREPTEIAIGAKGVYWIDAGAGALMWAPLAL
jgi:hypothetical protein